MTHIDVRSSQREQMIDVTDEVRSAVAAAKVRSGLCVVFCPHTTAGVTIQENADPDVQSDLLAHLARVVPQDPRFRHAEGNADAHIKSTVVGVSVTILVEDGELVLGRWQGMFFCEFDGPRGRKLHVKVVG